MAPSSPTATKNENMGLSTAASAAAATRAGGPRPSSSGDSAAHSMASGGLATDAHANTCPTNDSVQLITAHCTALYIISGTGITYLPWSK